MGHFSSDNTFGYEPAGIKLLNRVFDTVAEAVRARGGSAPSESEIGQAVLDVCYDDSGNIDVRELTAKVLAKLGQQ